MNTTLNTRLALAVSLLIFAGSAWIALKGPTTPIPMHFDLNGQANRFGDRNELALVLGGLGVLNLVVTFLTGHQVKSATDDVRRKALASGQLFSVVIMAGVAVMLVWSALGPQAASGQLNTAVTVFFLSAVSILMGAILGKVGPNAFIGVKTPWAYKSRLAWDKSNRLAGRLMFWLGVAGMVALPFAPANVLTIVLVVAMLAAAALSVFESWRVWRNDPEAQTF